MPTTRTVSKVSRKTSQGITRRPSASTTTDPNVDEVVARLKRLGTKKTRDAMARYAIPSANAFGVSVADIRKLGKDLGRDHDLAQALWDTGFYEA